jgi:hypothetical protein
MIANDAVRVLSEREMEAIVGGSKPPAAGDNDGVVLK